MAIQAECLQDVTLLRTMASTDIAAQLHVAPPVAACGSPFLFQVIKSDEATDSITDLNAWDPVVDNLAVRSQRCWFMLTSYFWSTGSRG